jgi:hypothetical protein
MQFEAPGELGMLLGLDRAPETKTIRRKLTELVERGQASRLSVGLAERWVRRAPRSLGYLYVDGHVRAYNGEKHRLTKTHVARRRLCMPATTDYWINDKNAEPVFFVTGEVNERLIATMKATILPEVRRLAGEKRRVTMVFDREGWSPKWFEELYAAGFDVLTYRKGAYDMWPRSAFDIVEGRVEGVQDARDPTPAHGRQADGGGDDAVEDAGCRVGAADVRSVEAGELLPVHARALRAGRDGQPPGRARGRGTDDSEPEAREA